MRSRMIATSLAGLALVLAGCGGDDDEETTTAASTQATTPVVATVTKAEYIAQADAICKTEDAASQAAAAAAIEALGVEGEPSDAQLTKIAGDIAVPSFEKQLTALRALPKPEADAAAIDAIYADLESAVTKAKEDPSILLASSAAAENPLAAAAAKAQAFGMKECGSSG